MNKLLNFLCFTTITLFFLGCEKDDEEQQDVQIPQYFEGVDLGGINDVTFNGPWIKNNLTWYCYRYSNHINESETREVLEKAFKRWSDVCNLTFTEVFSQSEADITLGFIDEHNHWITAVNQQCPQIMSSQVLAHAFPPNQTTTIDQFHDGDIHFLDTWPWTPYGTSGANGQLSLLAVAIHEIGHSLGLTHSNNPIDIMYPANQNLTNLSNNDVIRIVNLYGTNTSNILNPPSLILPSNISTISQNNINFDWGNITTATQYRIQISTNINGWSANNGFSNALLVDLNTSNTSYQWNNAQNNTTYYWCVKSINNNNSSNYSQPYQFTVSNNNSNASINLSTSNISFGNINVGSNSSQNFNITNNGNSPLVINNISSNNSVFSCNYSGTINSGLSQQVTANFSPINSQNYSGQLTVNSNSTSGNNIINLSGTGITVASNPIINISPISLNFGNVNVGSSSSQNITIQNIGNAPLIINNISSTNAYYFCGYSGTISAGSSIQTAVSFNPSSIGTLNSQLSVSSNATSGNNTISLSGVGTTSTSCNPIGNPSIGNYNTCESSSVVCNQARGIIKSRVVNVNCSANQITFEIRKCDGTTFNSSGIFYITNGTCTASVYGSVSFSSGQSTYQITINDNNMTGTKTYYGLIEQSAGQSICPPIQISY